MGAFWHAGRRLALRSGQLLCVQPQTACSTLKQSCSDRRKSAVRYRSVDAGQLHHVVPNKQHSPYIEQSMTASGGTSAACTARLIAYGVLVVRVHSHYHFVPFLPHASQHGLRWLGAIQPSDLIKCWTAITT